MVGDGTKGLKMGKGFVNLLQNLNTCSNCKHSINLGFDTMICVLDREPQAKIINSYLKKCDNKKTVKDYRMYAKALDEVEEAEFYCVCNEWSKKGK